jgi:hypothetical protein
MIKYTKKNKEGIQHFDDFMSMCCIEDIQVRQCSNSARYFVKGRTRYAGDFNIELRSGEFEGPILAAIGNAIAEHENNAKKGK